MQAGQVTHSDQRDILYYMEEHPVSKAGGKKEKAIIWNDGVCCMKSALHMMESCFPEYLPAHEKQ